MALSMLALAERSADYLRDNPESDSISPLPSFFRDGLIAISVFACLSFILTTSLWIYLTYKLVSWRLNLRSRARMVAKNIPDPSSPLHNLDFKNRSIALQQGEHARAVHESNLRQLRDAKNESPNQFLVLIYNLFLADMHQSAAFLLSASWLRHNGIFIHKASCFIQGYSDSNGDLSSSCFITFIAVHTYLSVVKGYEPPQRVLYLLIILIWIFVYSMSTIPLLVTHNGKAVGGYFVRAGAWCWISNAYDELRLATHYIFIFISLVATSSLYVAIFIHFRRQSRLKETVPNLQMNRTPTFLVYAVIYLACTLPLAIGRITAMAHKHVSTSYYCFAGSMIAANGLFDCIIFGSTRHSIVFGSINDVDTKNTGLETFSFMRTPARDLGNEVWIQGGKGKSRSDLSAGVGGWWPSLGKRNSKGPVASRIRERNLSQESLRGEEHNDMAIHMDVVTSMTVEERARYPGHSSSEAPSVTSMESTFPKAKGV